MQPSRRQTGIQVRVRTGDGIVLASQLLQEGSSSPADVYFSENSPELVVLTEHHLLAKLPTSITSQVPSGYDSPSGTWVGVALRISALVYNPSRISAAQLPRHLLDLAEARWKGELAIAPTDSDFPPLVGGVIARYGSHAARPGYAASRPTPCSTRMKRLSSRQSTAANRPWA